MHLGWDAAPAALLVVCMLAWVHRHGTRGEQLSGPSGTVYSCGIGLRLFLYSGGLTSCHSCHLPGAHPSLFCVLQLDTLIKATIAGGGVIPHIHKSLINKQGKKEGLMGLPPGALPGAGAPPLI